MSEFYLLSLRHSQKRHRVVTWWGPNDNGYVFRLEQAGRYTAEQLAANPGYYGNADIVPVPCAVAELYATMVANVDSSYFEPKRPVSDRVVPYKHRRALVARRWKVPTGVES